MKPYKSERHAALDAHYPSACNGNCNQGRMCDCLPAVAESIPRRRRSLLIRVIRSIWPARLAGSSKTIGGR